MSQWVGFYEIGRYKLYKIKTKFPASLRRAEDEYISDIEYYGEMQSKSHAAELVRVIEEKAK